MYADRDKAGMVSLMELSEREAKYVLEALRNYAEYCQTAADLFDNEYFEPAAASLRRMIKQMESI